jgi:hypothetical protein
LSENGHGWLTAWSTVAYTVLTAGLLLIAWLTYKHAFRTSADQFFSVPISPSPGVGSAAKQGSLDFQVQKCSIGTKLVSCTLTVGSPHYDRKITIIPYDTVLTDREGDMFRMSNSLMNLLVDRDQSLPFKMEFAVNKDIARPAIVELAGIVDGLQRFEHRFEIN